MKTYLISLKKHFHNQWNRETEKNQEKGLDFVFDMGVEASEGIVAEGIEFALLLDIILVVFPAY